VKHFLGCAHAEIGSEQRIFQTAKLLRIEPPVACEYSFHARGDFRACLANRFFEALEERRWRFVISKERNHLFFWHRCHAARERNVPRKSRLGVFRSVPAAILAEARKDRLGAERISFAE